MSQQDLRRVAFQYLRGLQSAGISDLPAQAKQQLASLIWESAASPAQGSVVAETQAGFPAEASRVRENSPPVVAAAPPPWQPSTRTSQASAGSTGSYGPRLSLAARQTALQQLQADVRQCERCPDLVHCRTQTVFGVGNTQPRLAFFGEAPGADEDRTGEPFVGRAGQLLNKIIQACQMSRSEVYIFNAVKCRPPGNRNPSDQEIDNCWEYAAQQLEILQPEYICCLGSVAARTLLRTKESIGRLRGRFHEYQGSRVMVTYHPAYLLRTPAAKAKTWEDMKMLLKDMDIRL